MKFAAHLDTLFPKQTVSERLDIFKKHGFDGFEFWCHWLYDIKELAQEAEKRSLKTVAFATEFFSLTDAGKRDEYLEGFKRSLDACKVLDCSKVISQVGDDLAGRSFKEQEQSIIDGLCAAGELAGKNGVTILVEPLNILVDHAGYFLSRSDVAAEIIEKVNSPNVRLLFDIYHQQISEGNLLANITQYLPLIAHFHIADVPGRHQPGTGEINYKNIFNALDEQSCAAYAGLEFFPSGDPLEAIAKFKNNFME